jgi:SWI/SNF-related matrix-associated actin-dependent regulator 1 of chromatin subfamily A
MINKYPGMCVKCGAQVRAEQGTTERNPETRRYEVFCQTHSAAPVAPIVLPQERYRSFPSSVSPYPHQVEGIAWLKARGARGGILADDMGLGKTMQNLMALPVDAPVVIVCPSVAKLVWVREAKKFAPDLKIEVLEGRNSFRWPAPGEAVVTNFEILPKTVTDIQGFPVLDAATLATMPAGLFLIVDEAHKVKNWQAQRTKSLRALSFACRKKAGRVWLNTGTPITNDPTEAYSMLVAGGLQFETFKGNRNAALSLAGGTPGEYGGWEFNGVIRPEFAERLRPVMLRRRKDEVLDLPPKRYEEIPCTVGRVKEADAVVEALRKKGVDLGEPNLTLNVFGNVAFEQMSSAREALARAKTPVAVEMAKSWVEDGEQVLVFSAHLAPVQACATLENFAVITGDTSIAERSRIEADFQAGKIRGIAATIKAAGVALTLTAATRVLFVDLAWTPADNEQAEDRAYRIGQTKSVLISTLVSNHSLDGRISALLGRKQEFINRIVEAARVKPGEQVSMPAPGQPVRPAPVVPVVVEPVDDFADLPF